MAQIKGLLTPLAQITVAAAGTPEQLSATELKVSQLVLQADPANGGNLYIGDINVAAAQCIVLEPGQGLALGTEDSFADEDNIYMDLQDLYVDAATNGDKLNVAYLNVATKVY